MFAASGAISAYNVRYKATERYSQGWAAAEWIPTWDYCEVCERETPHRGRHCIYAALVHGDYEWNLETCRWQLKAK
jgi:hypothetical protein